jgi:D-amino peptidase
VKIFISSDMEGTAGVVDWDQCRPGAADYSVYRRLLQAEVNAAIEGAAAGGATAFLVNDSHGRMANLDPESLAARARYLSGRHKPLYMMQGLDSSFNGIFFVSYHGSMGSRAATLSHTYNPLAVAEVLLNGVPAGESGINALVALGHRVPVLMVTGDATSAAELAPFCPGALSAVVKESVNRFAANSLHPEESRELIRDTAHAAVRGLRNADETTAVLPRIALPATLTVRSATPTWRRWRRGYKACSLMPPTQRSST